MVLTSFLFRSVYEQNISIAPGSFRGPVFAFACGCCCFRFSSSYLLSLTNEPHSADVQITCTLYGSNPPLICGFSSTSTFAVMRVRCVPRRQLPMSISACPLPCTVRATVSEKSGCTWHLPFQEHDHFTSTPLTQSKGYCLAPKPAPQSFINM